MITLELYKKNWNTKYLQYNPVKYLVDISHHEGGMNLNAWNLESGKKERSYGYFDTISIRTSDIPGYTSKSDIEVWG
jgi:hypothetical protein